MPYRCYSGLEDVYCDQKRFITHSFCRRGWTWSCLDHRALAFQNYFAGGKAQSSVAYGEHLKSHSLGILFTGGARHTWGSLVYRVTGLKYTKVWVMWWMRQTSCQWKGDVQYVKAEKPDDNILYFICRQSFENINTFDSGKRWHEVIWGSTCCPYAACSTRSFSSLLKPSCQIKPRPKKKAFWLVTGHG